MTQKELNRQVSERTGETVRTIRRRGFSLMKIECPPSLMVDWDEVDSRRSKMLQERRRIEPFAA
jgi:hypothetical protein